MDDLEFLDRFATGDLDDFPHADHVRMVYLQTRRAGKEDAIRFARTGLMALVEAAGNPGKYHETITTAWGRLVGDQAASDPGNDFDDFIRKNPQFLRTDLLEDYYSRARLFSPEARTRFVPPDLQPLP
ncbi:hypothetical protein [Mumia zhuanghuii]|uniref:Uncharacterized protein n=1 Tax=Mumia zhuanghuii TaxID=2585211 RepID=A0A5C4LSJ7_9ACTN|nr:hypothetical protein [Mumia zhuanghuii]TNC21995.1 hypothetical protein FHE65_35935 [Mumia zhuanghuii]